MRDQALNPYTGDYTGSALDDLGNAVYLRLATPLGTYWADKTLGSRLHELQREKNLPRVRKLAVQFAQMALAPLLADKRAKAVDVTAQDAPRAQDGTGRCLLHVQVTDNTGNRKTYQYPVKVA